MAEQTPSSLEFRGITKVFGHFVANDNIDFSVAPGEIHCLLGENGAGKSTLMNVAYGLLQPDGGQILLDGQQRRFANPREAMRAGLGMVHQHFTLVDVFTVAENIALGREPSRMGVLNMGSARALVRQLSEKYALEVDPDAVVEDLPVGVAQRVEILKALANDAEYLILDEPTAVLTPQEIDELMDVLRGLRAAGKGIVFITHKLREVRAVADRITVMRHGRIVGEAGPEASEAELAELMVGRAVSLEVAKEHSEPGPVRLELQGVSVATESGLLAVDGVDLQVRGGEILCVAGVQGNGQSELAEAILGLAEVVSGSITLDQCTITDASPRATIDAGVGFVPEDRQHDGFVGPFSIAENLVLNQIDEPQWSRSGALKLSAIRGHARERMEEFDIRARSIDDPVASLSGGNQQKVVLARELSRPLALLVASQPTRGVDVGAIEFLHQRIVAERDRGTAVLLVSTELDEVEALADRVAVMYRGRIMGVVPPSTPREQLGLMMAGSTWEDLSPQSDPHPEGSDDPA